MHDDAWFARNKINGKKYGYEVPEFDAWILLSCCSRLLHSPIHFIMESFVLHVEETFYTIMLQINPWV